MNPRSSAFDAGRLLMTASAAFLVLLGLPAELLVQLAGAFALGRAAPTMGAPVLAWTATAAYALFALAFARVAFGSPLATKADAG